MSLRFCSAVVLVGFLFTTGLLADPLTLSTKSRTDLFSSQTSVLDGRAATQYSNSARLKPQSTALDMVNAPYNGKYRGQYLTLAKSAALRHSIPTDLFLRLVQQESGWNPNAVSPKGAIGLAQLMPQTARDLGVNSNDPAQNLEGGARYLRRMYDRFGNWRLALAAYNAGPGAVAKYNGVPPFEETRQYVAIILGG